MTTLKERWIAALRSGEYEQTTGTLYDGCGFCCLGVLADITGDLDKGTNLVKNGDGCSKSNGLYGVEQGLIKLWHQSKLIDLNDEDEMSFADIADYIAKNVEVSERKKDECKVHD